MLNVAILVKSKQEGLGAYKSSQGYNLSWYVSKLIVLVPVEDQDQDNATLVLVGVIPLTNLCRMFIVKLKQKLSRNLGGVLMQCTK